MIEKIAQMIATLGPLGYVPASGTLASLLAIPFAYELYTVVPTLLILPILVTLLIITFFSIHYYPDLGIHDDPSEIVIDEFCATIFLFWPITMNALSIILGILLFRLFDITKILGIQSVQHLPYAWGIMADDFLAAGYTLSIVWLVTHC